MSQLEEINFKSVPEGISESLHSGQHWEPIFENLGLVTHKIHKCGTVQLFLDEMQEKSQSCD